MQKIVNLNEDGRRIGESHPRATLTDAEIDLVHQLVADGVPQAEVARKMGLSPAGVWKIVHHHRRGQAVARTRVVVLVGGR